MRSKGDAFRAHVPANSDAAGTLHEHLYDAFDANGQPLGREQGIVAWNRAQEGGGRLEWVIRDLGNPETRIHRSQRHNAFGEVIGETDGRGKLTESRYNTQGKLIAKVSPDTEITLANSAHVRTRPTTRYVHDALGRAIASIDANGVVAS